MAPLNSDIRIFSPATYKYLSGDHRVKKKIRKDVREISKTRGGDFCFLGMNISSGGGI